LKRSVKILALTASLTFAVACTTYAANTSFSDVPARHWAYEAVVDLAKAGLIDGSEDGTFRGDRAMSRYEVAILVSKSIEKYQKADASQKAMIDKLSAEFASELNGLGVRIAKVESKTNTWVSGETRLRYVGDSPSSDMPAKLSHSDQFDFRQRIKFGGTINEDWSWTGRIATDGHTRAGEYGGSGSDIKLDLANVTAKNVLGVDSVRIGRTALDFFSHSIIGGPGNKDGITITNKFGDVKFTGWTGNIRPSTNLGSTTSDNSGFTTAQLDWKANNVNVKTGYYWGDSPGNSTNLNVAAGKSFTSSQGYLVGFDTRIGDLLVFGDYIGTRLEGSVGLDRNPNAWMVQVTNSKGMPALAYQVLGIVNPAKTGTDAWMVQYRSIDPGAFAPGSGNFDTVAVSNTNSAPYNFYYKGSDNVNALFLAYSKVVAKNVVFSLEYQDLEIKNKGVTNGAISEGKNQTYQAKLELYY
jgi:hypothetical protein